MKAGPTDVGGDGDLERLGPRRAAAANRLLEQFVQAAGDRGLIEANLATLGAAAELDPRAAAAASSLLRRAGRIELVRRGGLHAESMYRVIDASPLEAFAAVPSGSGGKKAEQMAEALYDALRRAASPAGEYQGTLRDLGASIGLTPAQTRIAWRRLRQLYPIEVLQEGKRYLPTIVTLLSPASEDEARRRGPVGREAASEPSQPRGALPLLSGRDTPDIDVPDLADATLLGHLALHRLLEYGRAEVRWKAELAEWRARAERAEAALRELEEELTWLRSVLASEPIRRSALPRFSPDDRARLAAILHDRDAESTASL